ncbi:MAG TPA: hypothetical protein VLH94_01390, partial [Spirochaetia bacterium]|nr:hypothetical protein [Spirochaetia bacterium]
MVDKICSRCGLKFKIPRAWSKRGQGQFCSRKCKAVGKWSGDKNPKFNSKRFGKLNPNWKGGITNWR